jgi:large subunit ribosomal protein L3
MLYTLIGKKIGMTQVYDEASNLVPVSVIQAGPCPVIQVKTVDNDGYDAIQIAFGQRQEKNLSKAIKGHLAKGGQKSAEIIGEVRGQGNYKVGDTLTVTGFDGVKMVDVIGMTKGRGFQGVMKRWNQDGQPATHGHMMHRRPGSIGMRQTPGHVFKGKHMPGDMFVAQRTVQNLDVVKIIADKNLILVRGSIPGANGGEVLVRIAKKPAVKELHKNVDPTRPQFKQREKSAEKKKEKAKA